MPALLSLAKLRRSHLTCRISYLWDVRGMVMGGQAGVMAAPRPKMTRRHMSRMCRYTTKASRSRGFYGQHHRCQATQSRTRRRGAAIVAAAVVATALRAGRAASSVSGRVIARVMGYEAPPWLNGRNVNARRPSAIAALDIRPGQVVADVGAGSGYTPCVWPNAWGRPEGVRHRHPAGNADATSAARRASGSSNRSRTVAGTDRLPQNQLDLILMVDVYRLAAAEVLRQLRTALKPDGRLVLIEFRRRRRVGAHPRNTR